MFIPSSLIHFSGAPYKKSTTNDKKEIGQRKEMNAHKNLKFLWPTIQIETE
jgi:hypothetical protein